VAGTGSNLCPVAGCKHLGSTTREFSLTVTKYDWPQHFRILSIK
jgi:hypothetical protein